VVAGIVLGATGASAALLPGNILDNPDVEMAEPGANIFNVPNNWFRSSNNLDDPLGGGQTGSGPVTFGGFWDTAHSVSPTHSLGLIDGGLGGPFSKTEWRSFAAPMPAGTALLRWSWDVLYDITGGTPEFSVHARTSGPFVGTGNLLESPAVLIDHTVALTGNSGGQFVTMTLDVPVVAPSNGSFDIIFRTEPVDSSGNGDTLGTMFIDNVSVVAIPISEPTSLALLGIVGLFTLTRRVRRRPRIHTVARW